MKLTKTDEKVLESYLIFMEGLADYFGKSFEYSLYRMDDLDHSLIQIINGHYSNRTIGAPITDYTLAQYQVGKDNSIVHHHMLRSTTGKNGAPIHSVTIPIVGERNRIVGLACIDFHFSSSIADLMSGYASGCGNGQEHATSGHVDVNFATHSDDLITETLEEVKQQTFTNEEIAAADRNRTIISELYRRGIFNLKDGVDMVAKSLGLTKNTVYLYIRKCKKADEIKINK